MFKSARLGLSICYLLVDGCGEAETFSLQRLFYTRRQFFAVFDLNTHANSDRLVWCDRRDWADKTPPALKQIYNELLWLSAALSSKFIPWGTPDS